MTVFFGRLKQGTDVTFPTITVDDGNTNLAATGYSVACLFKPDTESATAVTPAIATGPLANGEVVLSLTNSQTVDMQATSWHGDVKITEPSGNVSKSETFTFTVVADVTP